MFSSIIVRRSSSLLLRKTNVRQLSTSRINHNAIQELYLRELKNVKLSPISAKDAEGSVRPWTDPVKPKTPELEGQGTDDLKSYSDQAVETKSSEIDTTEEATTLEDDWLVLDDVEEEDSHHGH